MNKLNNEPIDYDSVRINAEHDAVWEKERKDKFSYLDDGFSPVVERKIPVKESLRLALQKIFNDDGSFKV